MAYQAIPGTHVGVHTEPLAKERTVPCVRCGRRRQPTHNAKHTTGLCRDCRYTLSEEEIELWSQSTEAA